MKMRIETWFRNLGQLEKLRPDFVDATHGWASPELYVRECSKRFKHRNPRPYKNGLELNGDVGTIQRVSFED